MKVDKSLILTEESVKALQENIKKKDEEIKAAKVAQEEMRAVIGKSMIEQTKERLFKDIEVGDKVRITEKGWDGKPHIIENVFFKDVILGRYFYWNCEERFIEVFFNKMKKDGTPSLNTTSLYAWRIQKVEKV